MENLQAFIMILGSVIAIAGFALTDSENKRLRKVLGFIFLTSLLAAIYLYLGPFSFAVLALPVPICAAGCARGFCDPG